MPSQCATCRKHGPRTGCGLVAFFSLVEDRTTIEIPRRGTNPPREAEMVRRRIRAQSWIPHLTGRPGDDERGEDALQAARQANAYLEGQRYTCGAFAPIRDPDLSAFDAPPESVSRIAEGIWGKKPSS